MLTSSKRHTHGYYWCVEYQDDNGLITEVGNATTTVELTVWLAKNLESLPKGEGKFVKKKVGK